MNGRTRRNERPTGLYIFWILIYFCIVAAYGLGTEASEAQPVETTNQTAVITSAAQPIDAVPTAVQLGKTTVYTMSEMPVFLTFTIFLIGTFLLLFQCVVRRVFHIQ